MSNEKCGKKKREGKMRRKIQGEYYAMRWSNVVERRLVYVMIMLHVCVDIYIHCTYAFVAGTHATTNRNFRSYPTTIKTYENDTVLLPCYVEDQGMSLLTINDPCIFLSSHKMIDVLDILFPI